MSSTTPHALKGPQLGTARSRAAKPYSRPSPAESKAPERALVSGGDSQSKKSRGAHGPSRDAVLGGGSRVSAEEVDKIDPSTVTYPRDPLGRSRFRGPDGKAVTPHQWKVYDFILTVPAGRVTTYGAISKVLGSSAQSVGGALKSNPFAPLVPCHRVIATTLLIGGFQGEWDKTGPSTEGVKRGRKVRLLDREGVRFDVDGKLVGGKQMLWVPEG